jgi:hypothetical protein
VVAACSVAATGSIVFAMVFSFSMTRVSRPAAPGYGRFLGQALVNPMNLT